MKHLSGDEVSRESEHGLIKVLASGSETGDWRKRGDWTARLDPDDNCHIEFVIDLTTRPTGRPA